MVSRLLVLTEDEVQCFLHAYLFDIGVPQAAVQVRLFFPGVSFGAHGQGQG